ncbi:MAG TPA: hypothetical protein VFW94_20675 [Candidatus Acidoferrales bacterium]|nr:hypothetical protein [Candidatus Acidoferrales bacterium]
MAGTKHVQKTRGKARGLNDGAEQDQAAASIVAMGEHFEHVAKFSVLTKAPRSFKKPQIEFVPTDGKAGDQFCVKALGIVHQKTGMNLEEAREQFARAFGHVGPGAVFDLGQIGLAEATPRFAAGGNDDFGLSHVASEAA